MKLVSLKELNKMPNGTLFCESDEFGNIFSEFECIIGHMDKNDPSNPSDKEWFSGTVTLNPRINNQANVDYDGELTDVSSSFTSWDCSSSDYEYDQVFAVITDEEKRGMIEVLRYSLGEISYEELCDKLFKDKEEDEDENDRSSWS